MSEHDITRREALAAVLSGALLSPAALQSALADAPAVTLSVQADNVLRHGADKFVGVNLNYLRDADANRPHARPLNAALKDMGARWLRYPGGEKSDFYEWSPPPYDKPRPISLGWYASVAGQRLDFDQYAATARAVGAEPYVVAGYDTQKRTGRTKAEWISSAAAWVHYANVVRKYGVKYWEIGNENWHNGTATPTEMASIVGEFSRAMKAVDPTIKIGSSGNSDGWWSRFLPTAAPSLDFLTLSLYNCWGWKSYARFTQPPAPELIGDARTALNAIDRYALPADKGRLKVIVSETNSKDYSDGGWPGTNTLGHTLVTFETLGRLMAQPRILTAMVWTTRWINDAEAKTSQWYALGPDNEILPTGRAIALWGRFVHADLLAVSGGTDLVTGYASRSADGRALTVWIVNRGLAALSVALALPPSSHSRTATLWRLSGTGPDDPSPRWGRMGTAPVKNGTISPLPCPGVSVTVVTLGERE